MDVTVVLLLFRICLLEALKVAIIVTSALLTYLYLLTKYLCTEVSKIGSYLLLTVGHTELAIDKHHLHLEFLPPEQNLFLSIALSV